MSEIDINSLRGGIILNISDGSYILRVEVKKNGKKYTIICEPYIDATYYDCEIRDHTCYDQLIVCRVKEVEEG